GGQPPITPGITERGGKFGMQREASPRQSIERRAAAPVQRQKAARLAGGRAADGVTLDDGRPRAAAAREVGDRGADRAAAADHDARARERVGVRVNQKMTPLSGTEDMRANCAWRGKGMPIDKNYRRKGRRAPALARPTSVHVFRSLRAAQVRRTRP